MTRESSVQSDIRLAAAHDGVQLLRQNSGALKDQYGRLVRFGLANETPAMTKMYKSGDLIGIAPIVVGLEHVGTTMGVFVSVECKRSGWHFTGNDREVAQRNWSEWVRLHGGRAGFAASVEEARMIWK